MRERGVEFKVGALILVGIAILGGFVLVLGNFSLGSGYRIYVDYDFSGNIQAGAPVKVSGIKVGKIDEVEFLGGKVVDERDGRRAQVRLHVWLEERVLDTVRRDAEFFVNTSGVLGEQYLEIVPGTPQQPRIEPGSVMIGVDPPRTDLIVARLYEVLDSVSTLLREDRDEIRDLIVHSAGAVRELNALLVDNRDALGKLIVAAEGLAHQATAVMADVRQGIGDPRVLGRTVQDADRLLVRAHASLDSVTPKLEQVLDDAHRVAGVVTEQRVERALAVADGAVALTGKAGALVDNVNGVVTDVRAGRGTVGMLLVRDELYADVREMIRDLKRNPWKFFWKE